MLLAGFKTLMRTVPFLVVAALVVATSFFGGHPAAIQICSILFLLFAAQHKTAVCCCVALTLSAAFTFWPLRLSYYCSRSSLDNVAKQIALGKTISVPRSTGVFDVYEGNVENGLVCL